MKHLSKGLLALVATFVLAILGAPTFALANAATANAPAEPLHALAVAGSPTTDPFLLVELTYNGRRYQLDNYNLRSTEELMSFFGLTGTATHLESSCPDVVGVEQASYGWGVRLGRNHQVPANAHLTITINGTPVRINIVNTPPDQTGHVLGSGNVNWEVYADEGVLIISGTGAIPAANNTWEYPWWSYRSTIYHIIVREGITTIPNHAFRSLLVAGWVNLPASLQNFDVRSFEGVHLSRFDYAGTVADWEKVNGGSSLDGRYVQCTDGVYPNVTSNISLVANGAGKGDTVQVVGGATKARFRDTVQVRIDRKTAHIGTAGVRTASGQDIQLEKVDEWYDYQIWEFVMPSEDVTFTANFVANSVTIDHTGQGFFLSDYSPNFDSCTYFGTRDAPDLINRTGTAAYQQGETVYLWVCENEYEDGSYTVTKVDWRYGALFGKGCENVKTEEYNGKRYEVFCFDMPDQLVTICGRMTNHFDDFASIDEEPAAKQLVYNGQPQELVTRGSSYRGDMMFRLGASGTYSKDSPVATDAGTYEVWYYARGRKDSMTPFGNSAEGHVYVTISKATPMVTIAPHVPTVMASVYTRDVPIVGGAASLKEAPWISATGSFEWSDPDALVEQSCDLAMRFVPSDTRNIKVIEFSQHVTAIKPVPPAVATDALPPATEGDSYSHVLAADGIDPLVWSLEGGSLPNGMMLTSDGRLAGTPTQVGTYSFTVGVSNSVGADARELTLVVGAKPAAPTPLVPRPVTPQTYHVHLDDSPAGAGTVTGGGTYEEGDPAVLVAVANEGFSFAGWYENGTLVSTYATHHITVMRDYRLVAAFEEGGEEHRTLTQHAVEVDAEAGGRAHGGGVFNEGEEVVVEAETDEGFRFVGWYEGNELVSAEEEYAFLANRDFTLVARFEALVPETPAEPSTPTEPGTPLEPSTPTEPGTPLEPDDPHVLYPEERDYWVDLTGEGEWVVYRAGEIRKSCWVDYKARGDWYWLDEDGRMKSGWHWADGFWYYLSETRGTGRFGHMASGWQFVDGAWYYLNEVHDGHFGAMLRNCWIDGYHLGPDGRWVA